MQGIKGQFRLMAVALALVVCGRTAATASTLPAVKTQPASRSSYISSFSIKPRDDGYCDVSMKVYLSASGGGSCCGQSSSSKHKQRADFVVYFDWDGKGSSLDFHNIGHHEFKGSGSRCLSKKIYMPSKAKGTVWARAIIGIGELPLSATEMPSTGDYKDTSFDAGCEPPTLYRVNIGTYAEGSLVPSSLLGKISKYNAAIAGKDCKVYPLFKMTEETMKYLNSKGGFWVKCGSDKETKFKTSPVSKLSGGYNVYQMSEPLKFTPSESTKQSDYGKKWLDISYGGTSMDKTETKSWSYYVFFDIKKKSGGKPLWYKVWQDVIPGMDKFSYDSSLSAISELEYDVGTWYSTSAWGGDERCPEEREGRRYDSHPRQNHWPRPWQRRDGFLQVGGFQHRESLLVEPVLRDGGGICRMSNGNGQKESS